MTRKELSIVGFGNQGKAWAQNLEESGWNVRVLFRKGSKSAEKAKSEGRTTGQLEEIQDSSLIALLIPDDAMPSFFNEHGSRFKPKQSLIFAHGFSVHFQTVPWPKSCDSILVAPKGIGIAVRELFLAGSGVPAVLAVANDATGNAWEIADQVAEGIGASRYGTFRATFKDEVEADLFSEQALLCGGMPALIAESFNTLVQAGVKPEVAYLECVHELKFIADRIQKEGITGMLTGVSPTARFGGIWGGNRVVSKTVRTELQKLFDDVRSGRFTQALTEESENGFPLTEKRVQAISESGVEKIGREVRKG